MAEWELIELADVDVDTKMIEGIRRVVVKIFLSTPAPAEWETFFLEAEALDVNKSTHWRFDDDRQTVMATPSFDAVGMWEQDFAARAYFANRQYERAVVGREGFRSDPETTEEGRSR